MRGQPDGDDRDEIDQEMADHIGHQIAPPEIEDGQDHAQSQRDQDVRQAVGRVRQAEDEERNSAREIAVQSELLQPFDRVAAVEKFLRDPGPS